MTIDRLISGAAVACLILGALLLPCHAAAGPFPRYAEIEPNVAFWTKIYAEYATTQAVVHDSAHLDVIYGVIDLLPADRPGAGKINRQRMKAAVHRYEERLKTLIDAPHTDDPECRRIARLFGPAADRQTFRQARYRVRCQIGQCDRFRTGLIRSGAYIDKMREIIKSHGLPADLAFLPHVESSFDITATSKSGAAGIWQFTRSTGRRFLTVDDVRDERRDPIAATHAAARLLKENFEKLGSWPLAVTAYNHGAAGMQRAQLLHGDYPAIFSDYRGRTFKFASRNFYSEFLAARQVAADYQHYFGELSLKPPARINTVVLAGFVDWSDLCRHFEVPPHAGRNLNPALRPPVFSGQKYVPKGYVFNLPATDADDTDRFPAAIPDHLLKSEQRISHFYTVQAGDTAGRIARVHRVSLDDLMLANNLDRRATVYVRQRLRIPHAERAADGDPIDRAAITVASGASPPAAAQRVNGIPDSIPLETAGRRYRRLESSPAELLATAAGLERPTREAAAARPDLISPETIVASVGIARIVPSAARPMGIITVEVEETLGHYAEWADVSAAHLRRLNRLALNRGLRLHQEIQIPLDRVTAEQFEARRLAFHRQIQEDFFAVHRIGGLRQYRVQAGDSYWTLCREKFDLPLWLLRHYNADVDLAALKIHQALTIPAVVAIARYDDGVPPGDRPAPDA